MKTYNLIAFDTKNQDDTIFEFEEPNLKQAKVRAVEFISEHNQLGFHYELLERCYSKTNDRLSTLMLKKVYTTTSVKRILSR